MSKLTVVLAFVAGFGVHAWWTAPPVEAQSESSGASVTLCGTRLRAGVPKETVLASISGACSLTKDTKAADANVENWIVSRKGKPVESGKLYFRDGVLRGASKSIVETWNDARTERTMHMLILAFAAKFGRRGQVDFSVEERAGSMLLGFKTAHEALFLFSRDKTHYVSVTEEIGE